MSKSRTPRAVPATPDVWDLPIAGSSARFMREQSEVLVNSRAYTALPEIAAFIQRSREATTAEQHIELQRELVGYAWDIHEFDRDIRARIEAVDSERRQAVADSDLDRVRRLSEELPGLKITRAANKRRWAALRVVQDGIVWRLLLFDRFRITYLGGGVPVTWMSGSFRTEIAAAEEQWSNGQVAILCDLTSCVNHGDVLSVDLEPRRFDLIEVKETHLRDTLQMRRAQDVVDFINTGTSDAIAPERLYGPGDNRPSLRTHLPVLRGAITRAARVGYGFGRAGGSHIVSVLDVAAAGDHLAKLDNGVEVSVQPPGVGSGGQGDRVAADVGGEDVGEVGEE